MMKRADRAIISSGLVVAATTAGLAVVRGYGTVMFQLVVFGAWSIVARFSSGIFADHHQGIVWLVTLVVNVTAFSLMPAGNPAYTPAPPESINPIRRQEYLARKTPASLMGVNFVAV